MMPNVTKWSVFQNLVTFMKRGSQVSYCALGLDFIYASFILGLLHELVGEILTTFSGITQHFYTQCILVLPVFVFSIST